MYGNDLRHWALPDIEHAGGIIRGGQAAIFSKKD